MMILSFLVCLWIQMETMEILSFLVSLWIQMVTMKIHSFLARKVKISLDPKGNHDNFQFLS
jgi:hypothetical protein